MSLKNRIHNHLYLQYQSNPDLFVNGGEIERLAMEAGYKGSTASRRCRDLEEEGGIEKRENTNGNVEYRYKGPCIKRSKTPASHQEDVHAIYQGEFAGAT